MTEMIDAGLRIIETQGIVAFLLLLQMWLNSRERAALLHKNCELNHFIMGCLQRELDEDHKPKDLVQPIPKTQEGHDLHPDGELSVPG